MRHNLLRILLLFLIFSGSVSVVAQTEDPEWEYLAPGIEFRKFELPDPNNVFVARMDRNNPQVTLESTIATGTLLEGREATSSMFARYDQALNFWGGSANPVSWGMRNQAVVAINGSYFDLTNGVPQGGMVQSGWYAKSFDNLGGWGGFAWKMDRSAFISECLYHFPDKQIVTYPATGNSQQLTVVNKGRYMDALVMYTPQYNSRTLNDENGVEVVVEMSQPTMIKPKPAYAAGIVREIRNGQGKTLIPFDSVVLSATGKAAKTLLENVQVGSEVRISQEITSFEYDCETPYKLSWTKTYASIQGAFFYLKNGQVRDFTDVGATRRNPRSAIAFNDQYVFFIVVDGRDYYHSVGMTINQLALFSRDSLGATNGVAQDGGGSSTLVINGRVVNNTYCNINTCSGYYTPYNPSDINYAAGEQSDLKVVNNVATSSSGVERTVANGMLMVVVQPEVQSYTFTHGERVATVAASDIRLGPGTNYASLTTIPQGTSGVILKQMNDLEGVLAKSSYWWYVEIGGVTGWLPEEALTSQGKASVSLDFLPLMWKLDYLTNRLPLFHRGR